MSFATGLRLLWLLQRVLQPLRCRLQVCVPTQHMHELPMLTASTGRQGTRHSRLWLPQPRNNPGMTASSTHLPCSAAHTLIVQQQSIADAWRRDVADVLDHLQRLPDSGALPVLLPSTDLRAALSPGDPGAQGDHPRRPCPFDVLRPRRQGAVRPLGAQAVMPSSQSTSRSQGQRRGDPCNGACLCRVMIYKAGQTRELRNAQNAQKHKELPGCHLSVHDAFAVHCCWPYAPFDLLRPGMTRCVCYIRGTNMLQSKTQPSDGVMRPINLQ